MSHSTLLYALDKASKIIINQKHRDPAGGGDPGRATTSYILLKGPGDEAR